MLQLACLIWAISAALCWEVQAEVLRGRQRDWVRIAITSLIPVYNTVVAWSYWRDVLRRG